MKKFLFLIVFVVIASCNYAAAQTAQPECPPNFAACLTRVEVEKSLQTLDENAALKDELKVQKQSFSDLKDELNRIKIQLAEITGELVGSKSELIRANAHLDFLLNKSRCKWSLVCVQK